MLLAGLVSGATGGVGGTYNIMGPRYRARVRHLTRGEVAAATRIQSECNAVSA